MNLSKSKVRLRGYIRFARKKTVRGLKFAHHHLAVRPHQYLHKHVSYYRRWYRHIHFLMGSVCAVIIVTVVVSSVNLVSAFSTWTQTDWSGGVGTSTSTQYSSMVGINTSGTAGQVTLSPAPNIFTNSGLNSTSDNDHWLGADPGSVAGLKFYVKADTAVYTDSGTTPASSGQDVQQWNDQSGNSHDARAPSSSRRPTLYANQVNGHPSLTFTQAGDTSNNDDAMDATLSSISTLSDTTIFTVGSFDYTNQPAGNYDYLYSVYNSSDPVSTAVGSIARGSADSGTADTYYTYYNGAAFFGPVLTTGFKQYAQQFSSTSPYHFLWLNRIGQSVQAAGSESTISNPKITIGKWQNGTWALNGRVAELLLFNTTLNATDRHTIENYLNNKYNLGTTTLTTDTGIKHSGSGSAKVVTVTNTAELLQNVNVGTANQYNLEAYAYIDGSTAVTSAYAELYYNGAPLSTSYASVGGGWYKMSATLTGANASRAYGVQVKAGKTVYVDDMNLSDYSVPGTLVSAVYDGAILNDWGTLSYTATTPAGTAVSVKVRSGNAADLSDAPAFSTCSAVASGGDATTACAPDQTRYVQYQVTLSGGSSTPVLQDIGLSYTASDLVAPTTNATALAMKKSPSGSSVTSNAWTNASAPYFSWSAGADDASGSGIKGYCMYLGQDASADLTTTKGLLGTSPVATDSACQFIAAGTSIDLSTSGYIATPMTTSNSPYYLIIKAVDNAGNLFAGSGAQFQFRFDNTPPTNPTFITAPSQFVSNKAVTLTWPTGDGDSATDANSGLTGLQYRIGNSGTWYGDAHNGAQDATDLLANDGSYMTISTPDFSALVEGNNIVSFRTWDLAGNTSSANVTTVVKINSSSPSSPQNATATPGTNTANNFAFSWLAPASFTGSAGNLTYCYTVNVLPTISSCTFTAPGVTSLPAGAYATQPGENTFYVVARDEASNINYATVASTTFTADTAAPGIPVNTDIADISVKSSSSWKLIVSWETPSDVGAGVANYKIYRSTNNVTFAQVATSSGTSYVDGGLSNSTHYYYKVAACDSANHCGAYSSVVNAIPTGKFTSPAGLIGTPSVENLSTRKASITWTTDRTSDSKIAYGTRSGVYSADEVANSAQTSSHSINLTNLDPGTTYYYKMKWTDEDGNTGVSAERTLTTLPAPTVKEVTTQRITLSGVAIQYTARDAAKVKIYYGKSEGFGGSQILNTALSESTYTTELNGLDDGAKYFFKINSFDQDGNEYDGTIFSFTTPARPRVSNLRFQPVSNEPTSTQKVTWNTNVPASSLIRFNAAGEGNHEVVASTLVTEHELVIKNLTDDTNYSLVAESRDKDGNLATSDPQTFRTALDTRPPSITSIAVEPTIRGSGTAAKGQIVVSWKTDEPATSQVVYAEGSSGTNYGSSSAETAELSTEHIVIISDLAPSKVYHLAPVSKDKSSNGARGADTSAIVGRATESVTGIILNTIQKIFGL